MCSIGQHRDLIGVIDADTDFCRARHLSETLRLSRADDFIGEENIVDTARRHRLNLGDILAAHPACARRYLTPGDLDAFMRLGVRRGAHGRVGRDTRRKRCNVSLHRIKIDD